MPSILSMPLFVDPDDVMLRMQLDKTLTGITEVVTSGIIGAQLHVQRIIDGQLQRQTRDAMYRLDYDMFSGIQPGGVFRLEVPSGFIRSDIPVLVTASREISLGATAFETFENVDLSTVQIERNQGYILIDAGLGTNCYVRIQCDTGFEDGTTPFPITGIPDYDGGTAYAVGDRVVYNGLAYEATVAVSILSPPDMPTGAKFKRLYVPIEQIPTNIYEAIMSMVPVIFDNSQSTNRNNEAVDQYKKAADHAAMLLQPYIRTKGFTFRPIWST